MINFRFHLVSLIAVFLALGLGILVGSTVVDQKIVNRLDREISSVRKENSDARKTANKALAEENSRLQKFIDEAAPFVGDARLDGSFDRGRRRTRRGRRCGQADREGAPGRGCRRAGRPVARRLVAARHRRARAVAAVGARSPGHRAGDARRGARPRSRTASPRRPPPKSTTTPTLRPIYVDVDPKGDDHVDAHPVPRGRCARRARAGRLPQRHRRRRFGVRHVPGRVSPTCS